MNSIYPFVTYLNLAMRHLSISTYIENNKKSKNRINKMVFLYTYIALIFRRVSWKLGQEWGKYFSIPRNTENALACLIVARGLNQMQFCDSLSFLFFFHLHCGTSCKSANEKRALMKPSWKYQKRRRTNVIVLNYGLK